MSRPRLTFHGAARSVTGSCFRQETDQGQILIDCGLFQGAKTEKELNYRPFPFAPKKIAAVILSHAHIDHSGLLPKLVRDGFSGAIHATPATVDLAGVMLPDSAYIQENEVEQFNRRAARRNRGSVEPICTGADAKACLKLFRPQPYDSWFAVIPGLRARFWNAGHLLGSTSIEIEIAQGAGVAPRRLLFSADIGPDYKLMHRELEEGAVLMSGLKSQNLHFTETREQSIALDRVQGFHIVIAASGMCDAGRIRRRLKNWLWRDQATVLFTGFQAEGTLGRILQSGARSVRIQGEEFVVRARIRSLDLYSGHADGTELVEWIKARLPIRHGLFLVHGEAAAIDGLAGRLGGVLDEVRVFRLIPDESFELTGEGAGRLSVPTPPRLAPERVARLDWHNDVSKLILDINDALAASPGEKARDVLIRRLQRALEDEPVEEPGHRRR